MECPKSQLISYREFSNHLYNQAASLRVPLDGAIELTARCNLACAHCYCVPDSKNEELNYSQICRIIDEITQAGCLWLTLTGGEPLMRKDFQEIYLYAKKKGLIINLFTNAALLTPEIADCLKEYKPHVTEITLYGITPQTYQAVTGHADAFKRAIEGINLLRERGIQIRLKTTVTTQNAQELLQIKAYAKALGLSFRFDAQINPKIDSSKTPCKLRLPPEKAVELELTDELQKKSWDEFCQRFWNLVYPEELFVCSAGQNSFFIDAYGRLHPCVIARHNGYAILRGSFKQGWDKHLLAIRKQKHQIHYQCYGCPVIPICDQCAAWAKLENNDWDKPVEYLCKIAHLRAAGLGMTQNITPELI